ncbi:hypothetical protein GC170_16770 [bacterium]|nr:hypothetical protein [bacterium]
MADHGSLVEHAAYLPPHERFRPVRKASDVSPDHRIRDFVLAAVLFCFLTACYIANGRYVGSGDCVPAMYLPIAMARGDGPWLDRFAAYLAGPDGRLPGYCEKSQGHVVSRYPVGPGLLLTPLVAPQVWLRDLTVPGWDGSAESCRQAARQMAKNASAVMASLSMVLLWLILRSLFGDSAALFGTLAAALGSGMWSTAAQAPWQHGPAVFCLCMVMVVLKFGTENRLAGLVAGFFAAMIVVCRTVDLPISAALGLFVLRRKPGMRVGFLVSSSMVAIVWATWNVYFFDHLTGGYAEIEKMHGWAHGIQGSWSTPLPTGLAGTFLSPSHGLIVYCPWVLAVLAAPAVLKRIVDPNDRRLAAVLGFSLLPTTIILAKYGCWWAGHCFGPRFWIDSTPVFAVFAAGLWSISCLSPGMMSTVLRAFLVVSLIWSAGLHAIAVATYPTSWHSVPTNVDRDHDRLWDFHDNEVTRGLREGPHPREWSSWF